MYIKHFLINYFSIIIQFQNTLHWSNLPSCFSYCEDLKLSILILHLVRLFSYPLNILHGDQDFKGLQCKPTSILSYQDIVQSYPDNILVLPWSISTCQTEAFPDTLHILHNLHGGIHKWCHTHLDIFWHPSTPCCHAPMT